MAIWPSTLPEFETFAQMGRQKGFLRTETDTGPFKQRRRFSAVSKFWRGTMLFDFDQKTTFETFYTLTIEEGSLEFDFIDPEDLLTQSYRFVQVPSFTALVGGDNGAALWRASFDWEQLP